MTYDEFNTIIRLALNAHKLHNSSEDVYAVYEAIQAYEAAYKTVYQRALDECRVMRLPDIKGVFKVATSDVIPVLSEELNNVFDTFYSFDDTNQSAKKLKSITFFPPEEPKAPEKKGWFSRSCCML